MNMTPVPAEAFLAIVFGICVVGAVTFIRLLQRQKNIYGNQMMHLMQANDHLRTQATELKHERDMYRDTNAKVATEVAEVEVFRTECINIDLVNQLNVLANQYNTAAHICRDMLWIKFIWDTDGGTIEEVLAKADEAARLLGVDDMTSANAQIAAWRLQCLLARKTLKQAQGEDRDDVEAPEMPENLSDITKDDECTGTMAPSVQPTVTVLHDACPKCESSNYDSHDDNEPVECRGCGFWYMHRNNSPEWRAWSAERAKAEAEFSPEPNALTAEGPVYDSRLLIDGPVHNDSKLETQCEKCGGTGWCDDAEPGDIGYSEWPCPVCNKERRQ